MLGFGEILVPANCKAVVNGRVEERTRFYLGRHEPIYFVNLTPQFVDVRTEARSIENVVHNVQMKVKLSIVPGNIADVVKGQGYSDRHRTRTIGMDDLRKQHSIDDTIKAIGVAYVHKSGFMDLLKRDVVFNALSKEVQDSMLKVGGGQAMLRAEDFTCELTHTTPDADLRAHISAAGFTAVAEYFRKRDAEPKIAETSVKIVAVDQEDRLKDHQESLAVRDKGRQEAAQDRNRDLKERVARYDFEYKKKRVEDDRNLIQEQLLNAAFKDKEEAALRERKKKDMELELQREEALTKIRATQLEVVLAKVAAMPAPDYSKVQTLVTDGSSPRENLLLALLTKAIGSMGAPEENQSGKLQKPKT